MNNYLWIFTDNCEYSTGWYNKFKKHHGLHFMKVCGEKASSDHNAANEFVNKFKNLMKSKKLLPAKVYNALEIS